MCVRCGYAHEYIVKPPTMTVQAGAELPLAALSTHVFLISQELGAAKDVKVGLYADGKHTGVPLKQRQNTGL